MKDIVSKIRFSLEKHASKKFRNLNRSYCESLRSFKFLLEKNKDNRVVIVNKDDYNERVDDVINNGRYLFFYQNDHGANPTFQIMPRPERPGELRESYMFFVL